MDTKAMKQHLPPHVARILCDCGTEAPFSSPLCKQILPGTYRCAGCKCALFSSEQKYDSGSGWPSFWAPLHKGCVTLRPDQSIGLLRIEVLCSSCGGHLGHVFDDGPQPTGKRYCINGLALLFEESKPDSAQHSKS